MAHFLLFLVSFFLVFTSSYLFVGIIKSKRLANSIIFLIITVVSQIIISIELLSLLRQINQVSLLGINFLVFIISIIFWHYKGKQKLDFAPIMVAKNRIIKALFGDKILLILSIFFVFASLVSLLMAALVASSQWDSMVYHIARIGFWLQNQTLAHYETTSVRQIIFPVNSEILILWPMIFFKRDYLAGLNQYWAYLANIFVLVSFLSYLKISTKRILWAVFLLASLPAVILQSSSAQNDIVLGFFLFSSLYLFLYGVIEKENKSLIFSAIAMSIAVGVKSSVFFFLPAIGIMYLFISIRNKGRDFYKPLALFSSIFILAFLILGSYNYFLNYLDFGNPLGLQSYIQAHTANSLSFKSFAANLIRYFLAFVDATGMKYLAYGLNIIFVSVRMFLFSVMGLTDTNGLTDSDILGVNSVIHENYALFGILGFAILLPLALKYGFTRVFSSRNRTFVLSLTGLALIIFILTISMFMGYERWNHRYLVSAVMLASPVLALSYISRTSILKVLICAVMIFNYIAIPLNNSAKPVIAHNGKSVLANSYDEIRFMVFPQTQIHYPIVKYLGSNIPDSSRIALVFSDEDWYYTIFHENPSWKIFPVRYENLIKKKVVTDYDYIVISGDKQVTFNPDQKDKSDVLSEINIDITKIPVNFKLIQILQANSEDNSEKHKYYIFKKISNSRCLKTRNN